jgi:hypothetical protein
VRYATASHHPADVEDHRTRASWYHEDPPSTADMLAKLRRVLSSPDFRHLTLTSRHPKTSTPSGGPGKKKHNRETRAVTNVINSITVAHVAPYSF